MKFYSLVTLFLFLSGNILMLSAYPEQSSVPISELPKHILAKPKGFSLVADFDSEKGEDATVYIINNSVKKCTLGAQGGDPCLKQEAFIDGKWVRSQPQYDSWCGNSYGSIIIDPRAYLTFKVYSSLNYLPKDLKAKAKSEIRSVRYRLYGRNGEVINSISNNGKLPVWDINLEIASVDRLALDTAEVEVVAPIATGERKIESWNWMTLPRFYAIEQLYRFPENSLAKDAILGILTETTPNLENLDKEKSEELQSLREKALMVVGYVFEGDQAEKIYRRIVSDPIDSANERALWNFIYRSPVVKTSRKIAFLDEILLDPQHHFWGSALHGKLRLMDSAEKDIKIYLESLVNDSSLPKNRQKLAWDIYYSRFLEIKE